VFSLKNRKAGNTGGRTAAILLQGIARHAFPSSAEAVAELEAEMETFGTRFESVHDDDAAIQLACEAVEYLQSYRGSTERFIAEEGKQMRDALAQLAGSLNLLELSAELENAPATGDLVAWNAGLRHFVGRICNEVDGLRQRNHEILQDLDRAAKLDVDSGTGLPGVSSAVRAIRTALDRGLTRHIYAFRIENMEATNRRFGFKAGDRMLLHFAQYVAQRLGADDVLFRWRGPCFVAVSTAAAADVSRIVTARLEYSVTVGSRQVEVPIASSWNMVKLAPGSSMDEVLLRLDEFAIRGT
jgi:GGDEF domain-containing protein